MNIWHRMRPLWRLVVGAFALTLVVGGWVISAAAQDEHDELDPAHNIPLPCELVSTPGQLPRSAKNIVHLANVCGFVGTDVEFQSRKDVAGKTHDYAFVGTMGAGLRIFDITDPAHPVIAGEYTDPGWENDVQVRGNIAAIAFDPLGVTPTLSVCLKSKSATNGGVDIVRLTFDPATATFTTSLIDCVISPGRGAHNSTMHTGGTWLAVSAPSGNGWVDVIDLRGPLPVLRYRIIGTSTSTLCPASASFTCIVTGRTWAPHDISFSRDGNTMYVAAVNLTAIVDVTNVLSGQASIISVIPNINVPGGLADPGNIEISHQSDVSADGKLLLITDERGGGLENTDCNTDANGVIGAGHFWALAPIDGLAQTAGASPATPKKIGIWIYPNPTLSTDLIGRAERGCTIHVFRLGGNGSVSPGPVDPAFDGVSRLPIRQLTTAHYGAGVWWLDFAGPPTSADGTVEDPRTTWGNTLGWSVMPGADTWSAKEYKGFIYTGDMGRGFDVFGFARCDGPRCVGVAPNTPGKATGGGQIEGTMAEMSILRGTAAGGRASFGFNAQFTSGLPTGHLTYIDHALSKKLKSTSIDTFMVDASGTMATFSGQGTVGGSTVEFTVTVKDMGEPGTADTLTIEWPGYVASGVLINGNIQVHKGAE